MIFPNPTRGLLAVVAFTIAGTGLAADTAAPEALTLSDAEAIALRNHPQVAIAQLQALVAQQSVKENQAAFYTSIFGDFDAVAAGNRDTRILAGSLNNPVIYDRVADGLGASELITDFGMTKNLVASARLTAKARTQNLAAVNLQILLNVEVNYFNTLQAQAVLLVAQATTKARQLLIDRVSALARNKLRSELDVSFAQVALQQSKLLLQKAAGDADGAQASLAGALGYRDRRHFALEDRAPAVREIPDVGPLIDAALQNRPDLLRLRYEQDAATDLARAQKDQNYPTVAAVGAIGNALSHDYRLPDKYAAGGIEVSIPIFAGGAYLARQRAAELKAQIAGQTVRDQEDNVSRDVQLAWLNFNTAKQRLLTTEELLQNADQSHELAQARYKLGSSSIVELTDAEVNATSAQIAEANARYDALIQQAILDFQTGTLR